MDSSKLELIIDLNGRQIKISIKEAKELRDYLNRLFKEIKKETKYDRYWIKSIDKLPKIDEPVLCKGIKRENASAILDNKDISRNFLYNENLFPLCEYETGFRSEIDTDPNIWNGFSFIVTHWSYLN